jgi:hypothetical protein
LKDENFTIQERQEDLEEKLDVREDVDLEEDKVEK